ncbi:MAG: hypothetical protein RL338_1292 [Chloroflexota bacterium]|jgi:iron(III) transport system permease protein
MTTAARELAAPAVRARAAGPGRPRLVVGLALGVGLLALAPLVYLAVRATGAAGETLDLVLRPRTATLLLDTLVMASLVGIGAVAIGLPVGWATARTDLPARRLFAVLTIVPLAIPSYVLAFATIAAVGPRGALADLLAPLGVEALPSLYGLPGAVLVLTISTYPYVALGVRAAVRRLDPALLEAARLLGDDEGRAFRRVLLPILLPAVTGGALLAILYALADFGSVSLLRYDSLSRAIYVQYRATFDRSLAAILALLLAGLALSVAWGEARLRASLPPAVARARARPFPLVPLGRWRVPATILCAAVVGLGVLLPVGVLVAWLLPGLGDGSAAALLPGAVGGTVVIAAGAAVAALVLAAPVAVAVVRSPGRLAAAIGVAAAGSYALPGIVVALAVVFLALGVVPGLYQTVPLLLLALGLRFLPQAVGPLRDGLASLSPRLEESARLLGRTPAAAFRSVALPLLRPGAAAGAALVFLSTAKELPLTLILAPAGVGTLATRVWSAVGEGLYERAAPAALLLVAVSFVSLAVLLRQEERS